MRQGNLNLRVLHANASRKALPNRNRGGGIVVVVYIWMEGRRRRFRDGQVDHLYGIDRRQSLLSGPFVSSLHKQHVHFTLLTIERVHKTQETNASINWKISFRMNIS